jgi:hypothetical protein
MAFGFGKNWWKRASGLSNAQRKVSRAIGVPLSGRKSFKLANPIGWLLRAFFGWSSKTSGSAPRDSASELKKMRKQVADAEIAAQKKQQADAVVAKENKLKQLTQEINKASKRLEECVEAWHQAGSPNVQQADLDRAKDEAGRCRALVNEGNRQRSIIYVKISYLKLAHLARKVAGRLGMPWFVPTMIGGAVFFTFAILVGLLTNSLWLTFALGGIGFLGGSLTILILLFFPTGGSVRKGIATLQQEKSSRLEPLNAAKFVYEEAQQRFDNLAARRKLQTECERASLEKQQLQEQYHATCHE